jgi:hypothetical protein
LGRPSLAGQPLPPPPSSSQPLSPGACLVAQSPTSR